MQIQNRSGAVKHRTCSAYSNHAQLRDFVTRHLIEYGVNIEELDGMKTTVPRGKINWDTLEKIEEDPAEWKEYDARRRSLEEKYGDKKVFNFINQQYRYNEAQKRPDRTAGNLYYNTAGEIEARDVSARRELSADERRAKKPAGANDDTVFANWGGV